MPTQINTFSAAVDDVITRSGRPDRLADALSFVRVSIRELQTVQGYHFDYDIVEDQVSGIAEPFIFTADELLQKIWRTMRSVQYPDIFSPQGKPIYAHYVGIGMRQNDFDYYYYKSGSSYVFVNAGGDAANPSNINIAYYAYAPILAYEAIIVDRIASFDLESNVWTYKTATSDADKLAARLLVTNWILEKWYDAAVEGALAKLFKTVSDERARSSFALYSSYRTNLAMSEPRSAFGQQI